MRTARVVPLAVVALLSLGALTACSAGASGGSTAGGGSSVEFQSGTGRMPAADSGLTGQGAAASGGSSSGSAAPADATDRAIVTTARLRLVADDPIAVASRITAIVDAAGGRVATSQEDPEGRASASLSLRIPATAFDATMKQVQAQGDVRDVSVDATDVTAQVTDYAVRIKNLQTSISRLQQLLSKATSSSALVDIEGALTDRQTNLEQLLAEQKNLTDQVSYATLDVSVVVPAAAPKGPGDFVGGLATGFQSLVAAVAATLVGIGVLLPWAVVLGAIGGVVLVVLRAVKRRARTA